MLIRLRHNLILICAAALIVCLGLARAIHVHLQESAAERQREEQIANVQKAVQDAMKQLQSSGLPMGGYSPNGMSLDPRIIEIMGKYRVGSKAAGYIAQAKLQILDQTDTSVQFSILFPDQTTLDETASIAADAKYAPTPADLERSARKGFSTHGAKLAYRKTGPKSWTYSLQYHVPYALLPPDLQKKLRPASSAGSKAAHFFDLVPSVYANDEEVTGEAVISVIANYFAESYAIEGKIGGGAKSLGADVPLALVDLLEDGLTYKGWMDKLNKIEDCAKHPTNPLTQKNSREASYKGAVLDQLDDAVGDVKSTAVPTLASDVAGYLSHFLPFGGGAVTTLILSTQDDAVSEYAEGRIEEAEKYIVPCEENSGRQASFTYVYKFKWDERCDKKKIDGSVEGSFELRQDPLAHTIFGGEGEGNATWTADYGGCDNQQHEHKNGPVRITLKGQGDPHDSTLKVNFIGDNLTWTYACTGGCNNHYNESGPKGYSDACEINGVDLLRGGTFSGPGSEPGRSLCTVTLPGQ
jgi:hypothetical protein